MVLSVGIVGLPNAGKSTLFRALTRARVPVAPYPFTTVDPNTGVAAVPDERLDVLARITSAERVVPATVRVVDIAGLVRGAHRGEGLGNRFLAHVREMAALLHVVRAFHHPEVAHVEGHPDPLRDIGVVETELLLADLETVQRRMERVEPRARAGDAQARAERAALEEAARALDSGRPARTLPAGVREALRPLRLLTDKPVAYVVNVAEGQSDGAVQAVRALAEARGVPVVVACLKVEDELLDLPEEEARAYRDVAGLGEGVLDQVVRTGYRLLDLVTFFTTESREVRAWPVPRGTRAPQAAGAIHSDMERGFVRAEVVAFDDLVRAGSWEAAWQAGKVRLEGRDYQVREGDVITFRFHV
ncbi:MAG: redox-regulated ATPase YchF [Armatimonadota bacterium]|nr:redox-regulated ATPase YchF [Armatimonadota bacterium]MDR5688948.1 redox-regulated ATPase YchF [Armatimonadota bacterium]MDR7388052.1 redox-regulated ATPase YchF [Armatimonadota bacterium]MDR7395129.1 redox-regulated ATPase YchF [Armatimonadota bacterium]MDR7397355.1 redox-regulated ATPase YchF [Armatimonadota bacterium]